MGKPFAVIDTALAGLKRIAPFVAKDLRGAFIKDYAREALLSQGIRHDVQEVFYTQSHRGVVRAIHFQRVREQAKLIRVICGKVYDVAVDLRPDSATFGQWQGFLLNADAPESLYIPEHFGHGYLVLEDAIVSYNCAERFYGEYDDGIRWDDPDIAIDWPLAAHGIASPILSDKDKNLQSFAEFKQKLERSGVSDGK